MKTKIIALLTTTFLFSFLSDAKAQLMELHVVKDYNSILLKCSNLADSNELSDVEYRDSCIVKEWQDLIRGRVIRTLNAKWGIQLFDLTSYEGEIFTSLSDWREARNGCEGLGSEYVNCMNYQIHLITNEIIEEIKLLNIRKNEGKEIVKDIKDNPVRDCIRKNGSCSSCHCSEIYSNGENFAGYPLCSKVLDSAGELYKAIIESLIEGDFLKEGEPYTSDIYGIGEDPFEVMKSTGWTVDEATTFPTETSKIRNSLLSDKPLSSMGCFEGSTKITRLSKDSGFLGFSSSGAKLNDLETKSTISFYSELIDIKDIEEGDYVLSSTVSAVLAEHLHKTCWAEVKSIHRSALADWGFKGFKEIEYRDHEKKNRSLKVTGSHRFYAYRYDYKDGDFYWFRADDPKFNNQSTHVYSDGASYVENNRSIPRILDIVNVKDVPADPDKEIYNLSIPRTFTYFVGEGLLAHNLKILF